MTRVSIALALCWILGCGGRVPRGATPATSTPFCFSFAYRADGRPLVARACWQAANVCREAAGLVAKHGRLAHVTRVSSCAVTK